MCSSKREAALQRCPSDDAASQWRACLRALTSVVSPVCCGALRPRPPRQNTSPGAPSTSDSLSGWAPIPWAPGSRSASKRPTRASTARERVGAAVRLADPRLVDHRTAAAPSHTVLVGTSLTTFAFLDRR